MNRAELLARITEAGPLRYTPAGMPALDLVLEHESDLEEAGQRRTVKARIRAVSFGALAERLARQAVGSQWRFTGFLATPGNSQRVVLHIQEFQTT